MKLIATKSYHYATRRLKAGDEFEAVNSMQERAMLAAGVARRAKPEPEPKVSLPDMSKIDFLRSEAARFGIEVDDGWSLRRLRAEIAARSE